jgi:hypothetical protein
MTDWKPTSTLTKTEEELSKVERKLSYRELVGELIYIKYEDDEYD